MISLVSVAPVENANGVRVEVTDDDTTYGKTIEDEKLGIIFAMQLAEFFDAEISVDPLTGANGNFLTARDAHYDSGSVPGCPG